MPKKYPKETRIDALYLLQIHNDINTVHQLTGIPTRTLRYWRTQLREKTNRGSAEKSSHMAAKPPQNPQSGNNIEESGNNIEESGNNLTNTSNKTDDDGNKSQSWQKGIPSKTYPYPIEEDEISNTDQYQDFKNIRDDLMQHAQTLAKDLLNTHDDVNLRSLALARILDRIMQLDQLIPDKNPEKLVRIEYLYNGSVHNIPPWLDAPKDDPT